MNILRLKEILDETTIEVRKGNTIQLVEQHNEGKLKIHRVYGGLPSEGDVDLRNIDMDRVDCFYIDVLVDTELAKEHKTELIQLLKDYPQPDRLKIGLSYQEMSNHLNDFRLAFPLFALGKTLKLWDVLLPTATEDKLRQAQAVTGAIRTTGWQANG